MVLRLNATVHQQGQHLITKLGNPSDHKMDETEFSSYTVKHEPLMTEITVWSRSELDESVAQDAANWVVNSLGWGAA